jgi:probable F420-dependent oxidoreductase
MSMQGTYGKPLATMRTYLERMGAMPADVEEGARPVRLLAALGPKMIELSAELADGAHPYGVTPGHTETARAILGTDKWLIPEQAVAIGGDADDQLRRARTHIGFYLQLQNYRNSFRRQGFEESDLADGGSDRLVRSLVGMGGAEHAAASITAHLDAGADHVVVQIIGDGLTTDPRPALRELAAFLNR